MVGADHPSGADTKVETGERPQASDAPSAPPPDRPGSPGQPSRAESLAAARAPAESGNGGEQRDDRPEKPAEETGTENAEAAVEPEETRTGESGAEKNDDPREAERPGSELGRDPNDDPSTAGRPRAESLARAIEGQKEDAARAETPEPETDTEEPQATDADEGTAQPPSLDAPDQDPPADKPRTDPAAGTDAPEPVTGDRGPGTAEPEFGTDGTEAADPGTDEPPGAEVAGEPGREDGTEPPADRDEPQPSPEGEERPDEIQDGPGDDNDEHGRNAEDQSGESEEADPVVYRIRMPDGRPFGPPDTDRWVYHRGQLDPINENQDLSEPDPEKKDTPSRLFRSIRENPDDVQKHLNGIGNDLDEAVPDRPPPTGNPASSQDTRPHMENLQNSVHVGDVVYAVAATALIMIHLKNKISDRVAQNRGE